MAISFSNRRGVLIAASLLTASLGAPAPRAAPPDPFAKTRIAWNAPQAPFRVIGNIYYVGMAGVSAFLIHTPDGDILTDGGLPESAGPIERHIRALGFDPRNVRILLNSHAHFDHAGGLAQLKRDTGARLYASAADRPALESGRIAFGPSAATPFPPVKVDHVVRDGEQVRLGGMTLTAHVTPGHTKGCTSWTTMVWDGKARRSVMFFCSISVAGNPLRATPAYPGIVRDYEMSFARLEKMQADVFLAPHGAQFGLAAKLARRKPGAPNPFVDPAELHRFLRQARADFDAERARQSAQP